MLRDGSAGISDLILDFGIFTCTWRRDPNLNTKSTYVLYILLHPSREDSFIGIWGSHIFPLTAAPYVQPRPHTCALCSLSHAWRSVIPYSSERLHLPARSVAQEVRLLPPTQGPHGREREPVPTSCPQPPRVPLAHTPQPPTPPHITD